MSDKIVTINGPHKDFELIKKIDESGLEYWTARELMDILGYSNWQNFEIVINKSKQSCINSRQFPQDHFIDISKMVKIGSDTISVYLMTRGIRGYIQCP